MQVSSKVNGLSSTDITADTKAINWSPALNKVGDTLRVNTTANKDSYLVKASQIQSGSYLLDQVSGNSTPFAGSIESYAVELLTQRLGYQQAFLSLILKGINQRHTGHLGWHILIKG